ncbi:tetratricopeptide repeat protein [Desulfosarcina sp.]|uniref:tetratricopeptide repeat protein n=1 Tax=Desulfosarcina sp. TaxID=2027861 RepID=UPI00356A6567
MRLDEADTVVTLKACRKIISRMIVGHHGRVIDSPGDNLLADFTSVVDAVQCALEIQDELKTINDERPDDRQMAFRIGINLGDVIEDGDRIYGDGVNIAARMEGLAAGGGICISGSAYEQIQNKVPVGCEFIGRQAVKNIATPIPVFRIWKDPHAASCSIAATARPTPQKAYLNAAVVVVLVLITAVAVVVYQSKSRSHQLSENLGSPMVKLPPGKPSIAVLPFENLSDDPDQVYFSDGITDDIITDLSKFSGLAVTASHTTFKYKGQSPDITALGKTLRVKYILEGSIQKAGDHVRINAQLIDTASGNHIWAHRFSRSIEDIFELQDEIVETTVKKLAVKVNQSERALAMRKGTANLGAYDYYLQAYHHHYQRTLDGNIKARQLFQNAITLDPNFAAAYVGLAKVREHAVNFGYTEFPNVVLQEALDLAKKAVQLDNSNASAHGELGYIYMRFGEYDLAKSELQKAIDLNPNDFVSYRHMAAVLLYSGLPDESLAWYEKHFKFDPDISPGGYMNVGIAHFLNGDDDKAIDWLKQAATKWPTFLGAHIILAAIYGNSNQLEKAKAEKAKILRLSPFFRVEFYGQAYRNPNHREKIVAGLRKASLS